MNMKAFLIVVGSSAMLSAMFFGSACIVVGNGTGGGGGSGASDGSGGAGGTATHQGGAGGVAGTGGAGGSVPCDHCGIYITSPTPGADLCPDSLKLFDALATCLCGDPNNPAITSACGANGTIDMTCADNSCKGLDPTPDCTTCQGKANGNECKMQFDTCSNDI